MERNGNINNNINNNIDKNYINGNGISSKIKVK